MLIHNARTDNPPHADDSRQKKHLFNCFHRNLGSISTYNPYLAKIQTVIPELFRALLIHLLIFANTVQIIF